jgi:hypothetical protein
MPTFLEPDDNRSFNDEEQARIRKGLAQLAEGLKASDRFTAIQLTLIDAKVEELLSASTRLGRRDWRVYLIGTVTSIAITAAFAPAQTRAFLAMLAEALKWLILRPLLPGL